MARKRRAERSPQNCLNCGDPLGDSEALRVTGTETGRTWFVHRPSSKGNASMCFRYAVFGESANRIEEVVRTDLTDPATQDAMLRRVLSDDEYRWQRDNPRS